MNENDLREALHDTLTASPPPPPMDSTTAVAHGRRAVRRRTALAGTSATAVLIAIGVLGVSVGPKLITGGGGQPTSVAPAAAGPTAPANVVPAPHAPASKSTPWPTEPGGKPQQDATARSGPRYEQGKHLLQEVLTVVPAGYTTPTGTVTAVGLPSEQAGSSSNGLPLRDHQAAIESGNSWGYLAYAAVARNGGTGRLLVEVHTKGNGLPAEPCALARQFWGMGGQCSVVTVGKAKVGVVQQADKDNRVDQWAAYRYPDGIVVYVAQSKSAANVDTNRAPLTALPLTVPKLAALATDHRFHLS